eukprot:3366896-Rhodomonas_salina.2
MAFDVGGAGASESGAVLPGDELADDADGDAAGRGHAPEPAPLRRLLSARAGTSVGEYRDSATDSDSDSEADSETETRTAALA